MAYIDDLKSQRDQLAKEYEAIQAEFSSGKNFTSGAAEIDREAREMAKYYELRRVNEQIRLEEGKVSSAGQTAEQKANNDISETNTPAAEKLSNKEIENLKNAESNKTGVVESRETAESTNTNIDESVHVDISGGIETQIDANKSGYGIGVDFSTPSNVLHDYTNYTYRLTLWLLSESDYQLLTDSPKLFEPTRALISSGGAYANTDGGAVTVRINQRDPVDIYSSYRHPDFLEDFYFENLTITTVVGLNAKTKASNAVEISFSIIEPYGMSLLDRLMSAVMYPDGPGKQPSGVSNYIEQPYLLQIDFLSDVSEAQAQKNIITSKRMAIKIVEIKVKPGPGGTEYKCRAIPFNHSAFQQTVSACPVNLSITAGTLGEYFDSEDTLSKIFDVTGGVSDERIESELKKWNQSWDGDNPPTVDEINLQRERIKAGLNYKVKSLPAAYNSYMTGLTKGKRFKLPPSLINVFVDNTLKKSTLVDENQQDTKNIAMADTGDSYSLTITKGAEKAEYKTQSVFNVHRGTDIPTLIDRVVMSSSYIRNQTEEIQKSINNAEQDQIETRGNTSSNQINAANRDSSFSKNKFIDWYKIVPQIHLNGFDSLSNSWSKVATFSVIPYKVPNAYHPDFKKTKIPATKIVRDYNYLYTGLNQDIISMDIDFDATYYTSIGTYQKEKIRGKNFAGADIEMVGDENQSTTVGENTPLSLPIPIRPVSNPEQESAYKLNQDPRDFSVASFAKSIYSSSRGDMLNLKLRIVGDPSFIKQDDIYYNPMSPEYQNFVPTPGEMFPPVNPVTGQILFDVEQVFVRINVLNAVDIDDNTGITNKQILLSNGRATNGTFSGIYKVLTVRNEFIRGKFEQVLDLVRMPDELIVDIKDKKTDNPKVKSANKVSTVEDLDVPSAPPVAVETDDTNLPPRVSELQQQAANRTTFTIPSSPSDEFQVTPTFTI